MIMVFSLSSPCSTIRALGRPEQAQSRSLVNKKEILEPERGEMRWQQLHPVQGHGADGVVKLRALMLQV